MLARFLTIAVLLLTFAFPMMAKELKVLMIGNSFSVCVGNYLPQIVAKDPSSQLVLTSAYIGGCRLDRHYNNLVAADKNPKSAPYAIKVWNSEKNPAKCAVRKGNINELLKNNQYDIITIQQGSIKSFDFSSYEPYAGEIIKYIRKYQKNAEIVIQQTWSYRSDSPRFPTAVADQQVMYDQLKSAYGKLAEKYQLRIIPTGDAVQIYRAESPVKFKAVPLKDFKKPALPSDYGDVVGKFAWRKNKKTGEFYIGADSHHLNDRGDYMQAALWYMFLFGKKADDIKFVPANIPAAEADLLKKCAAKALEK